MRPSPLRTSVSLLLLSLILLTLAQPATAGDRIRRSGGSAAPAKIELEDEQDSDADISRLFEAGRYAEAIPLARKNLEQKEQSFGPDHLEVASALNNLAWLLQAQGDYLAARELFERALKIRESKLGTDSPDVATSLNNLGALLSFQGDLTAARPLYERALQINEKVSGPDSADVAASLNNLAVLLDSQGNREGAVPLYERALKITEASLGPDHPDLSTNLNNLASILGAQGNTQKARPLLERALKIREKALGPDHPDVAESLNNLAMICRAQGDADTGEKLLERALSIYESALGPDHLDVATTLNNLGELERKAGNVGKAQELILRAALIINHHVQTVAPTLSLAEQRAFAVSKMPGELSLLLSACNDGKPLASAYDIILRWKGLLIESLRRQTAITMLAGDPDYKTDVERLQSVRAELAGWYHQAGSVPYKAWKEKNDSLTAEKESLERQLQKALKPGLLEDVLQKGGLAAFRERIKDDEAVVDLYRVSLVDTQGGESPHYLAVVTRAAGDLKLVDLGVVSGPDDALALWRRQVLVSNEALAAWETLSRTIWKPLLPALPAGVKKIWVCPDGELSRLPWHLLPETDPKSEKLLLSTVDSPRELAELRSAARSEAHQPQSMFLAGGINFNAGAGEPKPRWWPLLPGTLEEVRALKGLADREKLAVTELEGDEATKAGVMANLPRSGYCHLATHGFFFNAAGDRLWERKDRKPSTDDERKVENVRNPLVESGICLTGANAQNPATVEKSGLLTAEELVGLDLAKVRLITLSACETGRGAEVTGQGVLGLRASVMAAGASSMVMSLWKVPDLPTRKLMEYFYTNLWQKKLPPVVALRQAQLAVRNEPYERYKMPVNWAAWVLVGEAW